MTTRNNGGPKSESPNTPGFRIEPGIGAFRFTRFAHVWRALRYRNFRLLFIGQGISLIGSWVTRVATSWLVYRLTHSALLLGWIGFTTAMPIFLLAPFAGLWADKVHDKRRLIAVTQIILMLTSFFLAGLTLLHRITILEILVLNIIKGATNAFDMPARQSFISQAVENRDDLGNAIALNSSIVNIARLLGPSIAGAIMAFTNEGWCFLIDGVSYIAVVWCLFEMRVRLSKRLQLPRVSVVLQMKEGWIYVSHASPFRNILLLFAVVSLLGIPYTVLMPIFATNILHGGPQTLGWLLGAPGIGALCSALWLASRKTIAGLLRTVLLSSAIFGISLVAFSLSRSLAVSLGILLFVGFGMMQSMAASSTILQTLTNEEMRGRVMSYYIMAMTGMLPFGNLLAGWFAQEFGAQRAILFSGAAVLLASACFWWRYRGTERVMHSMMRSLGLAASTSVDS